MKKIILCFDGTGNEPKDADQDDTWFGFGGPEDDSISNVLKLHLMLGGDLQGRRAIDDQFSFYYSGVGTYGTLIKRVINLFSAPPHKDVGNIIKHATCDLFKYYEPGDKLFIFGFSRGAAIARRFASVLNEIYGALGWDKPPQIDFMGVFDTVAAIKKPNLVKQEIKPTSDVVFENHTISPLIEKTLHLLSIDERRIAFLPTLMNRDPKVTEVWFAGAHSDVGGGYLYDGLSDNALQFMIDFIVQDQDIPLTFLTPAAIDYNDLFEGPEELIKYEDVIVQPNPLGKSHEQSAITNIKEHFLDYRSPRVNVNDKHSIYPPIIHRSVFDRMAADASYNPKALGEGLKNPYTDEKPGIVVWEHDGRRIPYDTVEAAKCDSIVQARTLNVAEKATFTVYANVKFNVTGIRVGYDENEAYVFTVNMDQKWFDATIECGPGGWDRNNDSLSFLQSQFIRIMEGAKRHPEANWFEVIGAIGRDDSDCFKILDHVNGKLQYKPQRKGELFAFANDLPRKYGNNRGSITVIVERIA